MAMTPETIEALGKLAVPIATGVITAFSATVTGVLALLQSRCRQELNAAKHELDIAHAMLRAKESGKTWVEEMRHKPREKSDDRPG